MFLGLGLLALSVLAISAANGVAKKTYSFEFDYPASVVPDQFVLRYSRIDAQTLTTPSTNWTIGAVVSGTNRSFTVTLDVGSTYMVFATAEITNGVWLVSDPSNVVTIFGPPILLRVN